MKSSHLSQIHKHFNRKNMISAFRYSFSIKINAHEKIKGNCLQECF